MNKALPFQLVALVVTSLLLAVANNLLRPNAAIEWVRDWQPYSALAAEKVTEKEPDSREVEVTPVEHEPDRDALAAQTAEMVVENAGITDIGLEKATRIHTYAKDFTFWIDARSQDLYDEGHIQGARLLHLYEKNEYLPEVEAEIQSLQPVALVIYCKGKDCTDSHHLSQDLQALGYPNIFVYTGGFDEWYLAGNPIEGALADQAGEPNAEAETKPQRALPDEKPPGMYVEHIVRDLVPFVFGLFLAIAWKRTSASKAWVIAASVFVGLFFIYAAVPKIGNPFMFAKDIWNYDIAPAFLINLSALLLPMLELTAGIGLITGIFRKGSGLMVSMLLVIFIAAVSYNMLRGHDFNCGCTSDKPFFPDLYLAGWNDKLTLLVRDFGLLAMGLLAFKRSAPLKETA